jgi:hypothetical protein
MNKPWKVARAFQNNGPDYFVVTNGTWGARKIACLDESSAETVRDLLAALAAIVTTYRTFRNVPKHKQEWTPLDDEALAAGFAAIAKARGSYVCVLCGQRIDDGKPCGCGARS